MDFNTLFVTGLFMFVILFPVILLFLVYLLATYCDNKLGEQHNNEVVNNGRYY